MSMNPATRRDPLAPERFEPIRGMSQDAEAVTGESLSQWQAAWRQLRANRWAMIGLYVVIIIIILAIVCPMITPYNYYSNDLDHTYQAPNADHWFGTDNLGRDYFARTWMGTRVSLIVGITAALADLVIGVIYGGIMGYVGGRVGESMNKIAEVLYAIPHLLIVILLSVVMGGGLTTIIIALSVTGWITMSWIVRGQIIQLKSQEYVLAARSMGAKGSWILFRHLLPNSMSPIIVTVTLSVPSAIFAEAFLSFIGLGVQSPTSSLGMLIAGALGSWTLYPFSLIIPASLLCITMLAFNIFGDGLRDALDPKMKS